MRAMKRTVSILLALMLVLGMATMGISVASAAETNTVTFTSNIGVNGTVDYTPGTTETVTVTYDLQSTYGIINTQGKIYFDNTVLEPVNANVLPNLTGVSNNILTDHITFTASSYTPADFSTKKAFVQVTFNVIGSGDTTVRLDVEYLTGNTASGNTTSETDVDIVSDSTADTTKFTASGNAVVSPDFDASAFIYAVKLNLEGKIGVNFYFKNTPTGYTSSTAKNVYVAISGPVDTEDVDKVQMRSLTGKVVDGTATRFEDYFMPAYMMTAPLSVKFYNGDEYIGTYTTSIAKLAEASIADYETSAPASATLLKSMLNYGAAVQTQFKSSIDANVGDSRFTSVLANANLSADDATVTPITVNDIVTPNDTNKYPTLTAIGVRQSRQNCELLEGVDIKYTVIVNNATTFANNNTVTVDGQTLTFAQVSEGSTNYLATLKNVVSNKLSNVYTFTFANGATYKTSVMSYMKTVLASNSAYTNLVSAMYAYNQAAVAVFGE